jgi:ABC-type antimicrobial peptide transport system permease subunit
LLFVDGIDTVSKLGQFDENDVSPDYFRTVGTRILRGRAFANDDSPIGPRVMIVSQAMAERLWPGRDAIGQCVRVNADTMPCTRVVAVAENIRNQSMSDDRGYYYYLPAAQVPLSGGGLFVRVDGSAAEYSDVIRRRLQREMPGASYVTTTPFADVLGSQTASWKMGAIMFTAFGALALIVAAIGLYSVIAYDVEQRTRELGVRLALGAQAHMLVVMVIRQGVLFAAIGVTTGIIAALTSARWVEPLLYNESPRDPLVFGFVGAVLLGVAVAASWTPAWRASRVDAQIALRSD